MEQHHTLIHTSDSPYLEDITAYRRLIGRLIYLTISRPDLSYSVHVLAQYMNSPQSIHWYAALKLVRYLSTTVSQGLLYASKASPVLTALCDAYWGSCHVTRQSLTGFCVTFGGILISWRCKKQQTVSQSSAEAEYHSLVDTCCEITWLVSLLTELHLINFTLVPFFCDNQSTLYIASNPVFHECTKHIKIDCHLVRQNLQTGLITTHISTSEQHADLFTKAMSST
ncbi:secreted RxLR effector protein 161-like [Apium graveolens]|uniref:secreted RxLR effector protein 161-like n=1 Tax=Apium graveolens TaxID=4045 RepID=UPI003D79CA2A